MSEQITSDICVIGGGSAGLSVAAGAAQMGVSTVLIEAGPMGGDCLNFGCVPSKALIAAANTAEAMRRAQRFGVQAVEPVIDPAAVREHIRTVIAAIAPTDSVERFEGLGVRVIRARAKFVARRKVAAGDVTVRARRFVIATGSSPAPPPIRGLEAVPYLTNETVFDLAERPEHLIVIGGGPIGCELAQAYRRLGARVTVLEAYSFLSKDDPELAEMILNRLKAEGVELRDGVKIERIESGGNGVAVHLTGTGGHEGTIVRGSHLLVAAGRRANVEDLGLEAAGIDYDKSGVKVDAGLRSSDRHVFAAGDVAGGPQFTHVAAYHAGIILRRALFRLPAKVDYSALPWVTYTDPELAHVGLTERMAREAGHDIRVLRWPLADNDRAQTEHATDGLIKVVTTRRGLVLGASIAAPHAGELIYPWIIALKKRLKIRDLADMIAPYPTLGDISKRAAGSFYVPALFGEQTRRLVRFLGRFG